MYIDIIMQKKKPIHPDVPEDDDTPVIVETDVDPKKYANYLTHLLLFLVLNVNLSVFFDHLVIVDTVYFMCINPFIYTSVHLSLHLSIYLYICPFIFTSVHLSLCLSIYLHTCPFIFASVIYFYICPFLFIYPFILLYIYYRATMITYHPSTVKHGGVESLVQPGTLGYAQEGGPGIEMSGTHAQHAMEVGSGGIKHLPPSVSH